MIRGNDAAGDSLCVDLALYRDLVDTLPGGVYRLRVPAAETPGASHGSATATTSFSVEFVSDRFVEILGIEREDLAKDPGIVPGLVFAEDAAGFAARNAEAFATRTPFRWEGRMNVRGEVRRIRFVSLPRLLADGDVVFTGVVEDVTDLRLAEEALRESHEALERRVAERTAELHVATAYDRSLIEASLDPLFTIDRAGRIRDVNDATVKATGVPREGLVGSDFADAFSDPEAAREGCTRAFREGGVRDCELRLRHRDGRTTPVEYNASVYRGEDGAVAGVVVAARDISARKKAEAELARRQKLFDDTSVLSRVGGWEVDLATNEQTWTDVVYEIHEVDRTFRPTVEAGIAFYAPESRRRFVELFERAVGSGEPYDEELELITARGRRIWVRSVGTPFREGDRTVRVAGILQDIHERRMAEEELRRHRDHLGELVDERTAALEKSNARLLEAQAVGHLGSWEWDPGRDELSGSEEFHRLLGVPPEKVATSDQFSALVDPEDLPSVKRAVAAALERKEPYRVDYRIVRPDGSRRHVAARGLVTFDDEGRPLRMAGTCLDVTELKEAEQRFRLLAEATSEGIVITREGKIVDCNGQFAAMFGCDPESLVGTGMCELVAPESAGVVSDRVRSAGTGRLEATGVRRDGTTFPLEAEARIVPYQGSTVRITAMRDLTDRKRAAEEIERVGRLHEALIAINEAIVRSGSWNALLGEVSRVLVEIAGFKLAWMGSHDPETHEVSVVASCGDETGYLDEARVYADERPEGMGPTGTAIREGRAYVCNDFLRDPRTQPWRIAAARASWRASAAFPIRNDDAVWGALTVYALEVNYFGDREVALLEEAASDLSYALGNLERDARRREAEQEVRRLNAELERRVVERTAELEAANRELSAFSYSVSHDLRAPLRAIEGFAAMVLADYGDRLDEEGRRLLGVVRANALRMSRLISDLLAFSRTSRSEMQRSRLVMTGLARSAFEEVVPDPARRAGIDFRLGELPDVEGDAGLVRQVWINLLSNAVKFSAGRERPVVEVEGRVSGDAAVYRVRDDGAGFDMAWAGKLFGVFQRLHGADEFEGTGVGLALVQRIVVRHGGRVWAEGAVGQGATFSFSLPYRPSER